MFFYPKRKVKRQYFDTWGNNIMDYKFQKGNQFWRLRSTPTGAERIFKTPEILWAACCQYFDMIDKNPLIAVDAVKSGQNAGQLIEFPKMRAMTIEGLCNYLDIITETWREYRKRDGYTAVCTRVEEIMRRQKFEGAAAEMLNHAIIARDLGLADRQKIDTAMTINLDITDSET